MNKSKSHSPEVFKLPKIVSSLAKANAARISMERFTGEEEAVPVGTNRLPILFSHPFLSQSLRFQKTVFEIMFIFWFEIMESAAIFIYHEIQLEGCREMGKWMVRWIQDGGVGEICPYEPVSTHFFKERKMGQENYTKYTDV